MAQMASFTSQSKSKSKFKEFAWILEAAFDDITAEIMDSQNVETMPDWFVNFGKVIEWVGSGDEDILPETVRQYLRDNHPAEVRAIEGPKDAA